MVNMSARLGASQECLPLPLPYSPAILEYYSLHKLNEIKLSPTFQHCKGKDVHRVYLLNLPSLLLTGLGPM